MLVSTAGQRGTTVIALNKMSARDLDQLITDARQERAKREELIPPEPPSELRFPTINPRWFTVNGGNVLLLRLRDVGCGWLDFTLDKRETAFLAAHLLNRLLIGDLDGPVAAGATTPTPTEVFGGGSVH